jgi:hypothetical protein
MTRRLLRTFIAAALVVAGWSVGSAQAGKPAFELVVTSGAGWASVKCASGCMLLYTNPDNKRPTASNVFTLECSEAKPCQSPAVAGALTP